MKYTLVLAIFAVAIGVAFSANLDVLLQPKDKQAACFAEDCTSSCDCAAKAQDFQCRCTNLKCGLIPTNCGGGCATDSQCADWAGGDTSCVCGGTLECENQAAQSEPGYATSTKVKIALKRQTIKEKLAKLSKDAVKNAKQIADLKTLDALLAESQKKY